MLVYNKHVLFNMQGMNRKANYRLLYKLFK